MPTTPRRPEAEFMSPCITQANTSCLLVMPLLTATCSIFPPDQSHLLSAVSMTRRGGRAIVTRLTPHFKDWLSRWGKRTGKPGRLVNLPGSAGSLH